jgi:SAM-dependent methyltransferase
MDDHDPTNLRQAWEDNARAWAAWARTPGHDHFFWRLNWPALTSLLPQPGRATLDLGCGEGRCGRWLAEHGHRVTGVDGSATLAGLARDGGGYADVLVADAAALPLPAASFDLVVACMSLQDVDDLRGAVDEAARVLEPGGCLCLAILHPMGSAALGADGVRYFDDRRYEIVIERDGLTMPFASRHRPLEAYTTALRSAGFVIEDLREPVPDAALVDDEPNFAENTLRPVFLHIRARR